MLRAFKISMLFTLALIGFACSNSVRGAAAPNSVNEPRSLVCENARMQRFSTNPRDCIERGGMLL